MSALGHRLRLFGGFSPLSIAGLQFWIDSSDGSTFTYSSGVEVSQWNDKSGNARHVSQGTVGKQPSRNTTRNSLDTVAFTAANGDELLSGAISMTRPVTVFGVTRYSDINTSSHVIMRLGTLGSVYTNTGNFKMWSGLSINAGADDALWHYFTWVFNGASSSIRKNGSLAVSGNTGANTTAIDIVVGSDLGVSYWDGDIAEILIYNSVLGTIDRDNVEAYLASKWGF